MIQQVNSVKILMKVLKFPDQMTVKRAITTGASVSLMVASYHDYTEVVGPFELVDIHNLRSTAPGIFSFCGRIVGVEIDSGVVDGAGSTMYVQLGMARVEIDNQGAQLEFTLNLAVHFL